MKQGGLYVCVRVLCRMLYVHASHFRNPQPHFHRDANQLAPARPVSLHPFAPQEADIFFCWLRKKQKKLTKCKEIR